MIIWDDIGNVLRTFVTDAAVAQIMRCDILCGKVIISQDKARELGLPCASVKLWQ